MSPAPQGALPVPGGCRDVCPATPRIHRQGDSSCSGLAPLGRHQPRDLRPPHHPASHPVVHGSSGPLPYIFSPKKRKHSKRLCGVTMGTESGAATIDGAELCCFVTPTQGHQHAAVRVSLSKNSPVAATGAGTGLRDGDVGVGAGGMLGSGDSIAVSPQHLPAAQPEPGVPLPVGERGDLTQHRAGQNLSNCSKEKQAGGGGECAETGRKWHVPPATGVGAMATPGLLLPAGQSPRSPGRGQCAAEHVWYPGSEQPLAASSSRVSRDVGTLSFGPSAGAGGPQTVFTSAPCFHHPSQMEPLTPPTNTAPKPGHKRSCKHKHRTNQEDRSASCSPRQ